MTCIVMSHLCCNSNKPEQPPPKNKEADTRKQCKARHGAATESSQPHYASLASAQTGLQHGDNWLPNSCVIFSSGHTHQVVQGF